MGATLQLCTFSVASELFGIEIEHIQEIIRDQVITRIPLAPPAVSGLINLRGQIVPVIDMRRCLSLPARSGDLEATLVVLRVPGGTVSLRVDAIGDVLEPRADAYEPAPHNVIGASKQLIRGVYKLDRALVLLLSTEALIELSVSSDVGRAERAQASVDA